MAKPNLKLEGMWHQIQQINFEAVLIEQGCNYAMRKMAALKTSRRITFDKNNMIVSSFRENIIPLDGSEYANTVNNDSSLSRAEVLPDGSVKITTKFENGKTLVNIRKIDEEDRLVMTLTIGDVTGTKIYRRE